MSRYFNLKWILLVLILFLIPCSFSIAQSSQHAKYNILNRGQSESLNVFLGGGGRNLPLIPNYAAQGQRGPWWHDF